MNTTQQTDYQKQANDFLESTQTEFSVKYLRHGKHFDDDKDDRDIYEITLKRGNRSYTFNFGQSLKDSGFYFTRGRNRTYIDDKYLTKKGNELASIIKSKYAWDFRNNGKSDIIHYPEAPTAYDVLSCLTKYEVGTFENFCSEFGYDTDSRKAEKTYKAVLNEWQNVAMLYNDAEIQHLQEIN